MKKCILMLACLMLGILGVDAMCYYGENQVHVDGKTLCLGIQLNNSEELLNEDMYEVDYQNNSYNILLKDEAIKKYVGNKSLFDITLSAYVIVSNPWNFSLSTKSEDINNVYVVDTRVDLFKEKHEINGNYMIVPSNDTYYLFENSSCIDNSNGVNKYDNCELIFETSPVFQIRYNSLNNESTRENLLNDNITPIIGICAIILVIVGGVFGIIRVKDKKKKRIIIFIICLVVTGIIFAMWLTNKENDNKISGKQQIVEKHEEAPLEETPLEEDPLKDLNEDMQYFEFISRDEALAKFNNFTPQTKAEYCPYDYDDDCIKIEIKENKLITDDEELNMIFNQKIKSQESVKKVVSSNDWIDDYSKVYILTNNNKVYKLTYDYVTEKKHKFEEYHTNYDIEDISLVLNEYHSGAYGAYDLVSKDNNGNIYINNILIKDYFNDIYADLSGFEFSKEVSVDFNYNLRNNYGDYYVTPINNEKIIPNAAIIKTTELEKVLYVEDINKNVYSYKYDVNDDELKGNRVLKEESIFFSKIK